MLQATVRRRLMVKLQRIFRNEGKGSGYLGTGRGGGPAPSQSLMLWYGDRSGEMLLPSLNTASLSE